MSTQHHVSKKLSREDLKHDAFSEWTARATEFLQENYLRVGIGLLAVVVVFVGVQFYQKGRTRAAEKAAYLLYQGETMIQRGDYAAARQRLQEVRDRFGDTSFARQAAFDLAQAQTALGEHEAALATIEQGLEGVAVSDPLHAALVMLKASVLGALGRGTEAVAALRPLCGDQALPARTRYDATLLLADQLRGAGSSAEALDVLVGLQREIDGGKLKIQARDLETRIQTLRALGG